MIPYVTPTDLLGDPTAPVTVNGPNDQAPLGINFTTISLARLWEMCRIATDRVDTVAAQTLRGQSFYDEQSGPGHRIGILGTGALRFITTRKPILSVVAAQGAYGQPPWQWNAIPVANVVPVTPTFSDFGSAGWEAADPGQAALLIGAYGGGWGAAGFRIGITYLSGWPVTGVLPATVTEAAFTASSAVVSVSSAEGIAVGAPVTSSLLPAGTTVLSIDSTEVTLSADATASGTVALTVGYPAGTTVLNVDDIATWTLGIRGTIYDGLNTEAATSASVSGAIMTPTPVGPGTITLATPTTFSHLPGIAFSAQPGAIRWATMLAVKAQALERGAVAVTAQSTPGRSTNAGGSAIQRTNDEILRLLLPYRRAY